jgi:rare lipoprotein A
LVVCAIAGCAEQPIQPIVFPPDYPIGFVERGLASWYGPGFHGNKTSNGERYDMHDFTAAHRTLPLGSVVQVQSLSNGRIVVVRINDRGPFAKGRVIDLSYKAGKQIGLIGPGTDKVELRVIAYEGKPSAMGYLRVQVASYSELSNANELAARLRRQFKDTRVVMVMLPEGRRYRVQVGNFRTEREAQMVAEQLEAQYQLTTIVLRDDV